MVEGGLACANEGNLSVRCKDGTCLVTPAGVRKNEIKDADLVLCTPEGEVKGAGKVSSEFPLHRAIYRAHGKVTAVVHAHPSVATAWAVTGRGLAEPLLAEAAVMLGRVQVVPFAAPASEELANAAAKALESGHAALLNNHGAVTVGFGEDGLETALLRMEILEQWAKVSLFAEILGGGVPLDPAQKEAVLANAGTYGVVTPGPEIGPEMACKAGFSAEDWTRLAHKLLHRFEKHPQSLEE